jgi:squalene synthase HpnC
MPARAGEGAANPVIERGPAETLSVDAVRAQAAAENFPVALRMLPARYRRHLMAVYVFARTADDIGDRAPPAERPRLLGELESDVRCLYGAGTDGRAGQEPASAAVRGLAGTVAECAIPMQPFLDLIGANRQDQVVTRYETFEELRGYCRLSADPVGRIVLHVFGSFTPERAELSDLVCTGLQLAEHWQDVAEDLRAGRIYLPAEDLRRHGCAELDLAQPHASPQVRELVAFEVSRAADLIDAGAPLIGSLRGAARVAVAGYVAGGRAALAAIRGARFDVLAVTPRPRRVRTAAEMLRALARAG